MQSIFESLSDPKISQTDEISDEFLYKHYDIQYPLPSNHALHVKFLKKIITRIIYNINLLIMVQDTAGGGVDRLTIKNEYNKSLNFLRIMQKYLKPTSSLRNLQYLDENLKFINTSYDGII
jgi:hypothetical protein